MRFLVGLNESGLYKVIETSNACDTDEGYYTKEDLLIESKKSKIMGVSSDGSLEFISISRVAQYCISKLKLQYNGNDFMADLVINPEDPDFAAIRVKEKHYTGLFSSNETRLKLLISYGVKELPNKAIKDIYGCDLVLPTTVKALHKAALGTGIWGDIDLYDYVGVIESLAFRGARFQALRLPANMYELPKGLFAESEFGKVFLSPHLKSLGTYAFYRASGFKEVILPANLQEIGKYSFYGSSLEVISLPANVKSVGDFAFADCDSLRYVQVRGSIDNISSSAFEGCHCIQVIAGTKEVFRKLKFGCYCDEHGKYRRIPAGGVRLNSNNEWVVENGIAGRASDVYKPLESVYLYNKRGVEEAITLNDYYKIIGVSE